MSDWPDLDELDRESLRHRLAHWPRGKALKVHGRIAERKRPGAGVLARLREGDELWWYQTPPETWEMLCGREGLALVRDGKIIDFIFTAIN